MAEFRKKVDVNTEITAYNNSIIKKNSKDFPVIEEAILSAEKDINDNIDTEVDRQDLEIENFDKAFIDSRYNDEKNEKIITQKAITKEEIQNDLLIVDKDTNEDINRDIKGIEEEKFEKTYSDLEKSKFNEKNEKIIFEKENTKESLSSVREISIKNIITPSTISLEATINKVNELTSNLSGLDPLSEEANAINNEIALLTSIRNILESNDLENLKQNNRELFYTLNNNILDLRVPTARSIATLGPVDIETINTEITNKNARLGTLDPNSEEAQVINKELVLLNVLKENPLEDKKADNRDYRADAAPPLNLQDSNRFNQKAELYEIPASASLIDESGSITQQTRKEENLNTYFQIFTSSVIPYGVKSLYGIFNQSQGALESFTDDIGSNAIKTTLLGLSIFKNASLIESFWETHTLREMALYFAFNLVTSFFITRDELSSIKDRSKRRFSSDFVFNGRKVNLDFGPRDINFRALSGVLDFTNSLIGLRDPSQEYNDNDILEAKKEDINYEKMGNSIYYSEEATQSLRNKSVFKILSYDNGVRSMRGVTAPAAVPTVNYAYTTQNGRLGNTTENNQEEAPSTLRTDGLVGEIERDENGNIVKPKVLLANGDKNSFQDLKREYSPNTTEFDPIRIIRFNRYNFENKTMERINPGNIGELLENKFGDLINNNRIGYVHVKPKDDSITEDIYNQFRIPFQFNPIINENSIEAKYATTSILNRVGDLYNFTGTGQFQFSLQTKYYVLSDGTPTNKGAFYLDNTGYDGLMQQSTLENIQAIENAWRSLVLPLQESQRNLFIPPPVVRFIIGGPRGQNNVSADTEDEKIEYSNILTYPSLSDPKKRRLRVFICTGVTIEKNFEETPFVFKGDRDLLRIEDVLGFSVSASFVEVDPTYNESLPDYKNYKPSVEGVLGFNRTASGRT